jgi:hypothetical protein
MLSCLLAMVVLLSHASPFASNAHAVGVAEFARLFLYRLSAL